MRHAALSTWALLMIAGPLLVGRGPRSETPAVRGLLARPIVVSASPQAVSMAFQSVMFASDAPGGEAVAAGPCGEAPKPVVRLRGTTLQQALDSITQADPRYQWTVVDGVINLLPGGEPPALLRARVSNYDSGPATDIVSAGTFLFALPQVREAAASLGLTHNVSGDFLMGTPSGPQPPKKRLGLRLHDVSVLDVLNALVRKNGHGVWTYSQTSCQGVHVFQLNFSQ